MSVRQIKNKELLTLVALSVFLSAICGTRVLGFGKDYHAYVAMFDWSRSVDFSEVLTFRHFDYVFGGLLILIGKALPPYYGIWFFLLGFAGVFQKLFFMYRASPSFYISVALYVASFFVLHDYTQIRAALGIGAFSIGLIFHFDENKVGKALFFYFLAISFHWSLVVLVLYAIVYSFGLIPFLVLSVLGLFGQLFIDFAAFFIERVRFYDANVGIFDKVNPFSSLKLVQYITLVMYICLRKKIVDKGWVFVDLAGLFLFSGLCLFFGFVRNPVLSHRLSELFTSFTPVLVSGIFMILPRRIGLPYVSIFIVSGVWSSFYSLT